MNEIGSRELVVKVEVTCFYCGHSCGEVKIRTAGRPNSHELRAAYSEGTTATAPDWDAHGSPRCPRCRGKLFIEVSERRPYAPAG